MSVDLSKAEIGGRGPLILILSWILAAVSILLIALRAYSARKINDKWRWDFIWAVVACVVGVVATTCTSVAVRYGLGNHLVALELAGLDYIWTLFHWAFIGLILGIFASNFAKFSMVALLLEVQGTNATKRKISLYLLSILFTIVNIVQIVVTFTQCSPTSRLWNRMVPGNCNGSELAYNWTIFQGSVTAFADLMLALMPVVIAWNLKTTTRVKVLFCLLMAVGTLPAIVTCFRITYIPNAATTKDITAEFGTFIILCVVEFWSILILSSIPVLRPLFLRVFYGLRPESRSPSGGNVGLSRGEGTIVTPSQIQTWTQEPAAVGKGETRMSWGAVLTARAFGPEGDLEK